MQLRGYFTLGVIACALALVTPIAAHAGIDGFNPESVKAYTRGSALKNDSARTDRMKFAAVAEYGNGIRTKGLKDFTDAHGQIGPALFDQFLPGNASAFGPLWTDFVQGSVVLVGRGLSDKPVLGFYNPLVDGWLLLGLKRDGNELYGNDLIAVTGAKLRQQAGVAGRKANHVPSPILANFVNSSAAFDKLHPATSRSGGTLPAGSDEADYAAILERTLKLKRARAQALRDPKVASALNRFEEAVQEGDAATLRAMFPNTTTRPPEWVAGIAAPVRRSLQPVAVFKHGDNVQVAYVSEVAGRMLVLVDLEPGSAEFVDIIVSDYAVLNEDARS